ncbi:fimbrial protein [Xenorhabdus japonica]|uniref:Major type 1 subunit fimbrin (Pilin) n=1 Tax=Xenorhabdus japonica TaxID=53341 RepID=A0A1I5AHX7_9GAMM|nr:fimbrial protein [Xenorhabdus japonica]SFN62038.1 major type 1 subunit fimbrin (pilin) [Xenorhabdus japonica]
MKLLMKSAVIVAIWGSMIVSAFAISNTGSITFTGKVTKGTCSSAVASDSGNVTMPDVGVGDFTNKGDTKGDTNFQINLRNCSVNPSSNSSVKIKFTGESDTDDKKVLKNSASGSSAAGVGIGIYNKSSESQIEIGGGSSVEITTLTSTDTTKELEFIAKYVATKNKSNIRPGSVRANANFTIEYD